MRCDRLIILLQNLDVHLPKSQKHSQMENTEALEHYCVQIRVFTCTPNSADRGLHNDADEILVRTPLAWIYLQISLSLPPSSCGVAAWTFFTKFHSGIYRISWPKKNKNKKNLRIL